MFQKEVFFRRLFSSVVLWCFVLWTGVTGSEIGFLILVNGLGLVALWEFYEALEKKGMPAFRFLGMGCGALVSFGSFYYFSRSRAGAPGMDFAPAAYDFEIAALVASVFTIFARQMFQKSREPLALQTVAYTLFGIFYVPWLFSFMTKLVYLLPRDPAGHITGHWYVLYLCVVAKFSDMGAYVTGSLIGKHLLIPHISPKKTWEGFFGALAFSVGGSFAMCKLLPSQLALLGDYGAAILGLALGFAAIIGDLAESVIKRSVDVKDSGKLLPGIGGALDLIDSLLFTAPILFFYLRLVAHLR